MCEEARYHVGREDTAHEQEDVLDPVEAAAQDEERNGDRRDRHARIPADSDQIEARGHTRELGRCRSDVCEQESGYHAVRRAPAVLQAHERHEPLPRHKPHAHR